jgi:hypothetical protein
MRKTKIYNFGLSLHLYLTKYPEMSSKYQEYKGLNLPEVAEKVMKKWDENSIF